MIGSRTDGRTFKVKVHEVLDRLRKGREEHLSIVEEAQGKFRLLVAEELEQMLADARAGKKLRMRVGLEVPINCMEYYDNAITTLEMTQRAGEDVVELTADEIQRFVRNKWDWMERFLVSNSGYSERARNRIVE